LLEWHGGQRWWKGQIDAESAKKIAFKADGHASIFRAGTKNQAMLSSLKDNPLTSPLAIVQDRLVKAFDPNGVFATGILAKYANRISPSIYRHRRRHDGSKYFE
jgi:hypothetical protein